MLTKLLNCTAIFFMFLSTHCIFQDLKRKLPLIVVGCILWSTCLMVLLSL